MHLTIQNVQGKFERLRIRKDLIKTELFLSYCHPILTKDIIQRARQHNNDLFDFMALKNNSKYNG